MATYKQLQDQIARLRREADATRQTETAAVVDKLKKQIALYGLTAANLGFGNAASSTGRRRSAGKKAASKSRPRRLPADQGGRPRAGVAKYRHPKTGATWSGYGRTPAWLASVKDRTPFLIGAGEAGAGAPATPATGTKGPVPKPAAKAARKRKAPAAQVKTAAKKAMSKRAARSNGPGAAKQPAARKRAGTGTAATPSTAVTDRADTSRATDASPQGAGDERSRSETATG